MKVTIVDNEVTVEDGPAPDPALLEDDGRVVAMLQALTWAMERIAETTDQVCAAHQQQSLALEQAKQARARLHGGLH